MSSCSVEHHLTMYIIETEMYGKRNYCVLTCVLLYSLLFSENFIKFSYFEPEFLLCHIVCLFYICNNKHRWQFCRLSSGFILHSECWFINYIVSVIPLRNSIVRKTMWTQKYPKNRLKAKTIQITVVEL